MLPAYAGMILINKLDGNGQKSAPRVCGDDPWSTRGRTTAHPCSPRMRG